MFSRCRYVVWLFWRKILRRPVFSILIILLFVYFIACIIIMAYDDVGFWRAALKAFPTFFGELGEIETPFMPIQISMVIGILASATFIVVITAKMTSVLIEFIKRGGSMAKKVNFSNHTIICGWNFQGERIVKELLAASEGKQRGLVILTDTEKRPTMDERVEFIRGNPSRDEELEKAGIYRADSVIVLTDFTKDSDAADAKATMIALAVESLNADVHTCVQIMNSANLVHLRHAHADEVICLDLMGGSLAVASALHHGVSEVVSELLTFNRGSEIYRYDQELSDTIVGKSFTNLLEYLAGKRMILLAIETDNTEELAKKKKVEVLHEIPEHNRVIIVNPQLEYYIKQGDALFIAAESQPVDL